MSYLNTPPSTMDDFKDFDFDCDSRPQFDRQRSYSAPEFRVIDVTATEAVIICSAAARASDRRRGRRDRRHVSLDVDAERSLSRHRRQSNASDVDKEMNSALSEVPEEEEEEDDDDDDQKTPTITLTSYAQNMASLMQQRINAIQYGSPTYLDFPYSPPMLSLPDDQLCPSPPSEYEEEDVMEIDPSKRAYRGLLLRPPLKSAFSAWSSAASTPATPCPPRNYSEDEQEEEATNYFNFPEPPKSRVDSITSTVQQDTLSKRVADFSSCTRVDDGHPPLFHLPHRQTTSHQPILSNFSLDRPNSLATAFSTPSFSCGQYFPSSSAIRRTMPNSPYEEPTITRVRHVC